MSDWRHEAACLQEDPELFFPIGNTGHAVLQIAEAKVVCGLCEVTEECLRFAVDTGQDAGVWGGLSEDERRAMKRRSARARRGTGRQPRQETCVPADATRRVFEAAYAVGYSFRTIATRTGCGHDVVRKVIEGQETVLPATEAAALAAHFPELAVADVCADRYH